MPGFHGFVNIVGESNLIMRTSLKRQFLLYVNLTLFAVLAVSLAIDFDYQKRIHRREVVADVNRQASTLGMWLETLPAGDDAAITDVLSRVTKASSKTHTSANTVLVRMHGGKILTPSSVTEGDAALLLASIDVDENTLVVGRSRGRNLTAYVLFPESEISEMSAAHSRWRLVEMGFLGVIATLLINLLLIRLMLRPFDNIMATLRRIAAGEWGATTDTFRTPELRSLGDELNGMSKALARAKREREMQMAKAVRLQNRLRGQETGVPGLTIESWHKAAESVAGDYFDVLEMSDGSWLICLADVTGHGVAAAMEVAILKSLLLSASERSQDLPTIIRDVNQHFSRVTLDEDFASLLIIRWAPGNHMLEWISAGHEPAYVLSQATEPISLNSTGTLIGLNNDDEVWELGQHPVCATDQIVLYTDGITEAQSPDGQLFGRQRLRLALQASHQSERVSVIQSIRTSIEQFIDSSSSTDDITLVGITIS